MTSYLRKYVSAWVSAKDYVAQWSADRVFSDEPLVVPFPTLAIFDPEKHVWTVHIKAWVYLPFQSKSLTSYLPPIPRIFSGSKTTQPKEEVPPVSNEDETKINIEPVGASADVNVDPAPIEADELTGEIDDDVYEDALAEELGVQTDNPGRLGFFFVGNSVKVVTKSIINGVEHLLNPSDESGFIEQQLEISDKEIETLCAPSGSQAIDRKFDYELQLHETKKKDQKGDEKDTVRAFKCTVYVPSAQGVSVISDIDDTVKISNVLSKRLLLKHTFYSYFQPVEGMSELYQKWSEQQCQFHYVSASPWQLYPALRSFLEKHRFPLGTMNLRKFAWRRKFFSVPDNYKSELITLIIDSYPTRKYICVGDSGEIDPEIYAKLYITYPEAIVHIFIRDVCSLPSCLPNCEERYNKAFENVPKERWTVFKDPTGLETDVKKLISI